MKVFSSQADIPGAWIGLTISLDSNEDIIYKWEDGFPMTSTYWAANQPDQQNIGLSHINRISTASYVRLKSVCHGWNPKYTIGLSFQNV